MKTKGESSMDLKHLKLVLLIHLGVFLISCAAYKPTVINPDFRPIDLNSQVQAGLLKPKVDNFYVIMDASGSQDETYRDRKSVV